MLLAPLLRFGSTQGLEIIITARRINAVFSFWGHCQPVKLQPGYLPPSAA
jgi:hypothetical protein